MSKRYSDKEIVDAIKRGDADLELQFLYDTTQRKIRAYILENSGSQEEAQDVFQDAVVAFFQHVLSGKFDNSKSIDGFIFSIGRNLWINRAKRMNKFVKESESIGNTQKAAEENNYLSRTIDEERAQKVEALLSKLGERCKTLLTYTIFYKMRMEEVAQIMGFSGSNAAKTQNYKCKQKLIKLLKANAGLKEWLYK